MDSSIAWSCTSENIVYEDCWGHAGTSSQLIIPIFAYKLDGDQLPLILPNVR